MNVNTEICKAFNKNAHHYEQVALVQHEIGERLFERLQYLKIKPRFILDLGCGPGTFSKRLQACYPDAFIIGFDLAIGMLKEAKTKQGWWKKWPLVAGDMLAMPFPDGLFDLVFANQVIHWAPSLPKLMSELGRVMNKNGCLMFSTLGPDTFRELRHVALGQDKHAHTNHFIDMHDVGDCLLAEHFLDPVVDMDMMTAHYPSSRALLQGLKAQGVRNINPKRNPGLTGKAAFNAFEQEISAFKTEQGKFPLTYEVVYGHAWKGEQRRLEKGTETTISVSELRKTYRANKE